MFGPVRPSTLIRMASAGVADRFLEAVLARDFDVVAALAAPDVRLRYLIPSGPGESNGPGPVASRFREWFGDVDASEVLDAGVLDLAGRASVRYRVRLREHRGWYVTEQQAYVTVDGDGRIGAIDLLCSGFRALPDPGEGTASHEFDAGTLGCADGLAGEFRRRIGAIPVGEELVVRTTDPAAKADLPPLARMMGHTVRSVEASEPGGLVIRVERGR
jgi:TusA-related sulfurtransferase